MTELAMDKDKKHKLHLTNYAMLTSHGINLIVSVFVSTFLVSYIYSISENYVLSIGLFYCFNYLCMGISYFLISLVLDKTNRVSCYRIAIVIRTIFIVCVIFLGKKLAELVILAGLLHGFSEACYWSSYNLMKNELVSKHVVSTYSTLQIVVDKSVNIIIPIILGKIIDADSFKASAIIVLCFAIIEMVASFLIKSNRPENSSFDMKTFFANIKNLGEKKGLVLDIIILGAVYGLTTIISPLNTILIMLTFNSNFSLGLITSLFSVCAMLFLFAIKKFTKTGKRQVLFGLVSILIMASAIVVILFTNKTTIVIYSLIYNVCSVLFAFAYDVHRNTILKKLSMYDDIAEFQASIEIAMELFRAMSFLIMILCAIFAGENLVLLTKILLIVFMCSLPIINIGLLFYEKKLKKFDLV